MVAGAIVAIVGVFLPWLTGGFAERNGTDRYVLFDPDDPFQITYTEFTAPGNASIAIAVVLAGLGIALFFAGRVLAVAIVGIIVSVIAVFVGAFMIGIASDTREFDGGGDFGIGLILQPLAPLAALAGSIVATATRRR